MKMLQAIPALPVMNINQSIDFYCNKLGFTVIHHDDGFGVFECNNVIIHLWEANDESWQTRSNASPVCSGAESFIAGTASCRIEVEGVDQLYDRLQHLGDLHPNAQLRDQWWGEREFAVTDPDNNLIAFFERQKCIKQY